MATQVDVKGKRSLPRCARVGIGILAGMAVLVLIGKIMCTIY